MQLDEYLRVNDLTQGEFARRLGVSQGMVWQWLHKRRPIAAEQVLPIERVTEGSVSRHELRPDIYPPEENILDATAAR